MPRLYIRTLVAFMPGSSLEIDNQVVRKWVWHCKSSNMDSVINILFTVHCRLKVILLTVKPSANIVISPGAAVIV